MEIRSTFNYFNMSKKVNSTYLLVIGPIMGFARS